MSGADRPLVVGIGSAVGDDAVGPAVARAVSREVHGVDVVEHADPSSLVELLTGRGLVVLVDAVMTDRDPGTVAVLTPADLPRGGKSGPVGTHAIGVGEAIELAGVLGRLPQRLVIVGVQAHPSAAGAPLSPRVQASVPVAVRAVADLIATTGG